MVYNQSIFKLIHVTTLLNSPITICIWWALIYFTSLQTFNTNKTDIIIILTELLYFREVNRSVIQRNVLQLSAEYSSICSSSGSIVLVSERVSLKIDTLHVLVRNGWWRSHPRYSVHHVHSTLAILEKLTFLGWTLQAQCILLISSCSLNLSNAIYIYQYKLYSSQLYP